MYTKSRRLDQLLLRMPTAAGEEANFKSIRIVITVARSPKIRSECINLKLFLPC